MNLYLRLLWLLVTVWRRAPVDAFEPVRIRLTVLPTDLDAFGHMNNGRYLAVMDLGRVDLMLRAGLLGILRRRRWFPVVGRISIEYRKALRPWRRYAIETRILGWDERWFYLQQVFLADEEVAAVAGVKAMFRSREGPLSTVQVLAAIGRTDQVQDIPRSWQHLQERLSVAGASEQNGA